MSNRAPIRLALLLAAVVALLAAPAAAAGSSSQVEGLEIDGRPFTQVSLQNVHVDFDQCGDVAEESDCVWSVELVAQYASGDCDGEDSAVLWSSGEIVGPGGVDSGPQAIALDCPGSKLTLSVHGPGHTVSSDLLLESVKEAEERIVRESPAAEVEPMPTPPRFEVSPDCRSLFLGERRYVFSFKRIGCRTARKIAARARDGGTPNGYRCARRGGGGAKCVRAGHPEKYVQWRLPRAKR